MCNISIYLGADNTAAVGHSGVHTKNHFIVSSVFTNSPQNLEIIR